MQQPPSHPPYPQYEYEEDEINLLDYVIVLLKYKWLIFGIVFVTGLSAVIITLMMPNIYRSEATIIPRQQEKSATSSAISALGAFSGMAGEFVGLGGGGDIDKFEVVLESRELARRVMEKYELMPELFEEHWDPIKKQWKENLAPTMQDAYRAIVGMLTVSRNRKTEVLTVKFDNEDPRFAKIMADNYLTELSESLREETLKDAAENKRFLQEQLEQTSDPLLKVKISELLAKEIEKETFARAQKYYGFIVLDPPIAPDPNKKVKPKRSLICILSVTIAGFFGIFLAFLIEYIDQIKQGGDEERLSRLKSYFRLRPIKNGGSED
jgi:uncharacterized protein involved in exopolysaccharide biosynthesis